MEHPSFENPARLEALNDQGDLTKLGGASQESLFLGQAEATRLVGISPTKMVIWGFPWVSLSHGTSKSSSRHE
jgi:hypothetical protein